MDSNKAMESARYIVGVEPISQVSHGGSTGDITISQIS